ncbi:DUF6268 family outer membrane beta-barrel protein [Luteolibacter flavescens]|uniref:DUF6268 family outer membrane beta-barrel protein n=1 Tax=Luteolibacter flavescens TaxID=1859460 RepID=A0ABT3FM02_9BACT|nr:DUF6268 family outer membrane beta-barrel protein [Luteolibacter flavescens]MCW1884482.1 DUF6268 family outer membrane beta-barrel protein [Luteolibacter flavescens]
MSKRLRRSLAALPLLTAAALAGDPASSFAVTPPAPTGTGFDLSKLFNAADVKYIGSFDMDFDNSVGNLETHAFQASAFLSQPIQLGSDWQFLPQFSYEAMLMNTTGPVPSLLLGDEDLHEIELSLYFLRLNDTSPWVYGAWINPALATDFQGISGDDFFLDAAGGVGYKLNDRLMVGLGAAALNITGDTTWAAGPGFAWQPNDQTMVSLFGPNFRATHDITPKWRVGVEVRPNGGIWNIDTALGSANIDYTNFRAGVTSSHNLAGDLWLSYGAGMTFGGEINVTTTDGSKVFQNQLDDLESGLYGFVGLDLKSW